MKKVSKQAPPFLREMWGAKIFVKMRVTLLMVLLATFSSFANKTTAQNASLSLNVNNSTVRNVLRTIEKETGYSFIYSSELIDVNRRVSLNEQETSLQDVLDALFAGTPVNYSINDDHIVLSRTSGDATGKAQPQGHEVSGKVTDGSGAPLPGVTVVIKGTTKGTITDANGVYHLTNVPENVTLLYSFVGMKNKEVAYTGQSTINLKMEEESIGLGEVVAVGYGVQKKSVVTGAIASVNSSDIDNTSVSQAQQALQGKTSGVQVINASGAPGAPIKVRIRGYSSNNNSNPIYIVDGIKTTDISNLDPDDISSMEVLKDAASTAIYGAEGGNGVVIITTKKGKSGKPTITYDFQYGVQSVGHTPKLMNTSQYSTFMNEAGLISNVDQTYNTDWLGAIFETAPMQKHHISFSGGKDGSTYMLSMSYLNQDGIVVGPQDKYKRYTVRLNSDHQILPWMKVGNTFAYSNSQRAAINESGGEFGGVIGSALMIDPATPVEYTGDVPAHVQTFINNGNPILKAPDGNYYGISKYVFGEIVNPFVTQAITKDRTQQDQLQGNVYAVLTPLKGLKITSRFNLNLTYQNYHTWNPTYYYTAERNNSSTKVIDNNDVWKDWMFENFASYNHKFGDHDLTLLLGMSSEKATHRITNAQGGPMIMENPAYAQLDFISSQKNDQVNGRIYDNRKESYFSRLSYNYKDKYLLEGSLRRDGAGLSQLPQSGRWGIFPAVSGGWVISNEDFFPKSFITDAKLRASWGQNGSLSNLGNYSYASLISSTSNGYALTYPMADGSFGTVFEPSQLANPNLRWETSVQTDVGLDLRAFRDRLTFTMDYYNKKTTDLITQNTPALEAGNAASPINAGDVTNKGFEFELGYRNKIHDFNYGIHLNMSTLKNEVTYLNPTLDRLYGAQVGPGWTATAVQKGEPLWFFYGYKTKGIDPKTGDPIFLDKSGQPTNNVTEADKQYIGSAIPNLYYGGSLDASYKNFDFNVNFQGTSGNDVLMGWIRNDRPTINRPEYFFKNRWTADNTTATEPRAGTNPKAWNSDLLVFNGAFMRIKQIQLGYNLPKSLMNNLHMKSARFYISLDDFFTFTNYIGMDPEAGTNNNNNNNIGIDRGTYPTARKVMFGTSISF